MTSNPDFKFGRGPLPRKSHLNDRWKKKRARLLLSESNVDLGDWIKNLVLFFDGIALLVPDYMKERPEEIDRSIVVGLQEQGLLEIIEPERAVDKSATETLAMTMTDIITSGVL